MDPGTVTIEDTSAVALDVAGGAEFGSGDVALIGTDGRIIGPLSNTILSDLSGANLTNLNGMRDVSRRMEFATCPLIVTEGFDFYEKVVRRVFGPAVLYGQVLKTRRHDRIVQVERRERMGASWRFEAGLNHSEDSSTLNTSFIERMPLRQTEGFVRSVLALMGADLDAPDHTTLSRRSQPLAVMLRRIPALGPIHLIVDSTGLSIVGQGAWAAVKHGGHGKRGWKKLHLGVDRSGVIVAQALTDAPVDDATTAVNLIPAVDGDISSVTADAAYDTIAVYEAAGARGARVVVPPKRTAAVSRAGRGPSLAIVPSSGCRRSGSDGGRRRRATIGRRAWRMSSSGTSRSSAMAFARGVPQGRGLRRSSRATC